MKSYDITNTHLADNAADSIINRSAQDAALESHLQALQERLQAQERTGSTPKDVADTKLQMARTLVIL